MKIETENVIIGAGIAGLVTALELLKKNRQVCIVDAQPRAKMGGLARIAFGGMALVGTPEQKKKGIADNPDIALKDWYSFAEFEENDHWPKAWARFYVENSLEHVYHYLKNLDVHFLPAVNWVERGLFVPGNSLPRYHIIWGCSQRLVQQILAKVLAYEGRQLKLLFNTKIKQFLYQNNRIAGCEGEGENQEAVSINADNTIIACGGFTGNLDLVKANWPEHFGKAPKQILNGSHPENDGRLHQQVERCGGLFTHKQDMWNYAAGIPHPEPEFDHHGLSLIPCKSALWLDHRGNRIGPIPLTTGYDTHYLCQRLSQLEQPWSWQILNKRIALNEFAISGSEHNPMIRDRNWFGLVREIAFGNQRLFNQMSKESPEFMVADNLEDLYQAMQQLQPSELDFQLLTQSVNDFDNMIKRGKKYWNDDQIRRILQTREWGSDKLRTCYPAPIQDGSPLVAIKTQLITRKSLGGIQTNLNSQVLDSKGVPLEGLFAVGEAAGFGGGGASGRRSLEGTFLSGCVLTAQRAAQYL